jgi:Aminotransferase class-III
MGELSALESRYGAANYKPLPVTLVRGEGVYVWDENGRRYLDMMGAYSAVSFGHCHPRLVEAMTQQARRLDTVSRAYFTDRLGPFLKRACELTGMDAALPVARDARWQWSGHKVDEKDRRQNHRYRSSPALRRALRKRSCRPLSSQGGLVRPSQHATPRLRAEQAHPGAAQELSAMS